MPEKTPQCILDAVAELRRDRRALIDRLGIVERALSGLVSVYGLSDEPEDAPTLQATIDAVSQIRRVEMTDQGVPKCVRCGQPFIPSPGNSGRYCSRRCYEGTPIDERRAALLRALANGPMFPSHLKGLPQYEGVSRATVTNDLYALAREGKIENSDNGWRLVEESNEPEEEVEASEPESPVPLESRSARSPMSSAH